MIKCYYFLEHVTESLIFTWQKFFPVPPVCQCVPCPSAVWDVIPTNKEGAKTLKIN